MKVGFTPRWVTDTPGSFSCEIVRWKRWGWGLVVVVLMMVFGCGGEECRRERERCRFAVFDTVSVERKVIRLAFKIWG